MTTTKLLTDILDYLRDGYRQKAIAQINSLADLLEVGLAAPHQSANRELPEAELGKVIWAWTRDSLVDLNNGGKMSVKTAFEQAVFIEIDQWGKRGLQPVLSPILTSTTQDALDVTTPHWTYAQTREHLIADKIAECASRADSQALRTLVKLLKELY